MAPQNLKQPRSLSPADLIIFGFAASVVIGILWSLVTDRDLPPQNPVYATCEPCGLTRGEIDELRAVVADTIDILTRVQMFELFDQQFDDPAHAHLCRPCAETILDAVRPKNEPNDTQSSGEKNMEAPSILEILLAFVAAGAVGTTWYTAYSGQRNTLDIAKRNHASQARTDWIANLQAAIAELIAHSVGISHASAVADPADEILRNFDASIKTQFCITTTCLLLDDGDGLHERLLKSVNRLGNRLGGLTLLPQGQERQSILEAAQKEIQELTGVAGTVLKSERAKIADFAD